MSPTNEQIEAVAQKVAYVKQITAQRDGAQKQVDYFNAALDKAKAELEALRGTLSVVPAA